MKTSSYNTERYVERANKICERSWRQMHERFARFRQEQSPHTSDEEVFEEASQNIFLAGMQFWFDDISWIGVPKGDERGVEGMLDTMQQAIFDGQEQDISTPAQLVAVFDSYNQLAQQYGVDSCLVEAASFEPNA